MNGRLTKDRLFIRLAADGTPVANSAIWRSKKPVGQGRWKDITQCALSCCDPQGSYVIFRATSLDADSEMITITFPGYSWSGTFANGDYMVVPLPYNQAVTMTVTVNVLTAAMAVSGSTVIGSGTITVNDTLINTDPDPQTLTIDVTSDTGSQYLVLLTDD